MAFQLKGLVGHVTSSVSDRYHIVSETDFHEAAQKLNEHKSGTATVPAVKVKR